ncbi:MAG TPA: hypothetical protein VF267_10500, partial [Gammaproteobacteria bacterium]
MLVRSAGLTLEELQVFSLGADVLMAAWDGAEGADAPINIEIEGKPATRQRAKLRLPTVAGPTRTILTLIAPGGAGGGTITVKHGARILRGRRMDPAAQDPALLTG